MMRRQSAWQACRNARPWDENVPLLVFSHETCAQLIEALKQAIGPDDAVAGKRCALINRQERRPLLCSSSLLRDSRGNILEAFHFLRDLTAEVTAEKNFQESYYNEESAKKALESKVNELSNFRKNCPG